MLDEDIIFLVLSKDETGMIELKKKYDDVILDMIKSILKDEKDINKCLELTYERIRVLMKFSKPKYLRVFLLRCARESAIEIYKEKYSEPINELDFDLVTDFTMDDIIYVDVLVTRLNVFFNKLSLKDLIIFVRRYFLNEDIKTIADRFELKEKEVNLKVKKITKIFKMFLKENGYEISK